MVFLLLIGPYNYMCSLFLNSAHISLGSCACSYSAGKVGGDESSYAIEVLG